MYKIVGIATLLVGLALAPVLGGVGFEIEPVQLGSPAPTKSPTVRPAKVVEQDPRVDEEMGACSWSCRACEADEGCRQLCTEVGDCGSACGVTAQCDASHHWDDAACACVK